MSVLHIETPLIKRAPIDMIRSYIKPIIKGFVFGLVALSLYAAPMAAAYFIFQAFFN